MNTAAKPTNYVVTFKFTLYTGDSHSASDVEDMLDLTAMSLMPEEGLPSPIPTIASITTCVIDDIGFEGERAYGGVVTLYPATAFDMQKLDLMAVRYAQGILARVDGRSRVLYEVAVTAQKKQVKSAA